MLSSYLKLYSDILRIMYSICLIGPDLLIMLFFISKRLIVIISNDNMLHIVGWTIFVIIHMAMRY